MIPEQSCQCIKSISKEFGRVWGCCRSVQLKQAPSSSGGSLSLLWAVIRWTHSGGHRLCPSPQHPQQQREVSSKTDDSAEAIQGLFAPLQPHRTSHCPSKILCGGEPERSTTCIQGHGSKTSSPEGQEATTAMCQTWSLREDTGISSSCAKPDHSG